MCTHPLKCVVYVRAGNLTSRHNSLPSNFEPKTVYIRNRRTLFQVARYNDLQPVSTYTFSSRYLFPDLPSHWSWIRVAVRLLFILEISFLLILYFTYNINCARLAKTVVPQKLCAVLYFSCILAEQLILFELQSLCASRYGYKSTEQWLQGQLIQQPPTCRWQSVRR